MEKTKPYRGASKAEQRGKDTYGSMTRPMQALRIIRLVHINLSGAVMWLHSAAATGAAGAVAGYKA